jgi:hypothetical protein
MTDFDIDNAAEAAMKFLKRIEQHKARQKRDKDYARMFGIVGYKETAAIRRSSLDLTRALAEMRKTYRQRKEG